jgi:hypothetical protein
VVARITQCGVGAVGQRLAASVTQLLRLQIGKAAGAQGESAADEIQEGLPTVVSADLQRVQRPCESTVVHLEGGRSLGTLVTRSTERAVERDDHPRTRNTLAASCASLCGSLPKRPTATGTQSMRCRGGRRQARLARRAGIASTNSACQSASGRARIAAWSTTATTMPLRAFSPPGGRSLNASHVSGHDRESGRGGAPVRPPITREARGHEAGSIPTAASPHRNPRGLHTGVHVKRASPYASISM